MADYLFAYLPALFNNEFNPSEGRSFIQPVTIKETDKNYQLEVMAPGFEKSDFNVNRDQSLLTIPAEKKN